MNGTTIATEKHWSWGLEMRRSIDGQAPTIGFVRRNTGCGKIVETGTTHYYSSLERLTVPTNGIVRLTYSDGSCELS